MVQIRLISHLVYQQHHCALQVHTSSNQVYNPAAAVCVVFIKFTLIHSFSNMVLRYLPLLIGDLVPEGDDHWQIFF